MAQRSEIDRRAKRYAPRQCVSDYGMHKDAPGRFVSVGPRYMRTATDEYIEVLKPAVKPERRRNK